jgi:hypothetical protein
MVAVPKDEPVTMPDDEPMGAITDEVVVHVPPAVVSANGEVDPWQILVVPVMAPNTGKGLTVNTALLLQPVAVSV